MFFACKESIKEAGLNEGAVSDWQITRALTQKHSYNRMGMLDTTRQVQHVYVKGILIADIDLYVTRTYDNNRNLIREKTFQVQKKYNELMDEKIFRYDTENNLIMEIVKSQNRVDEIFIYTYNTKREKVEEIDIIKHFDIIPEGWDADSALAHMDDKKVLTYDTTWISNEYESYGHNFRTVYKNRMGAVNSTVFTTFSNNKKVQSFAINSNGDTLSTTKYVQNGDKLIASIYNKTGLLSTKIESIEAGKLMEQISIIKELNRKDRETFKYDNRGNEIEAVWYR